MATAWGQEGAWQDENDSKNKASSSLKKTSPHLHLNVGLSVAATGLVAGVRVTALALKAALRGRSEGW